MRKVIEKQFWKPEPKKHNLLTYSLIIPIIASVLGFFIVGIFAFAFDAIDVFSEKTRDWITVVGSALVVLGAEANTPGTFVAVFRKKYKQDEDVNIFDWSAIVLSGIGTLANLLIVLAILVTRQNKDVQWGWIKLVSEWGPLIAGFAVACDYYGSLVELGFQTGLFEKRYEQWLGEKQNFEQEQVQKSPGDFQAPFADLQKQLDDLQNEVAYLQYPKADLQWFKSRVSSVNGSLAKYQQMDVVESVHAVCRDGGKRFTLSERTAHTWFQELKEK